MWGKNKDTHCCKCNNELTARDIDSHMCNTCLESYLNEKHNKRTPKQGEELKEPNKTE